MKLVPKAFLPIIVITLIISIVIGLTISSQIKDNTLLGSEKAKEFDNI